MQVGNRTQGGGKNEDDHYYMRGIGSERTVNFFSDTSVAVYIDGVWTDQTYATDGLFDVERVEVARGPQGTTGGRAAIAGAINFHTRKPTDEFDLRVKGEFTDVFTQRYQVAFGGPIKDTGLSYRLGLSRYTGEGKIENIGSSGIDAAKPDQTIIAPQLRWKNDRLDVTIALLQTDGHRHAVRFAAVGRAQHPRRVRPGSGRQPDLRYRPDHRLGGVPAQPLFRRQCGAVGGELLQHQQ